VSAAVATVFALAWPALIRSLDDRRWSAAVIASAALVLAGSYSMILLQKSVIGRVEGGATSVSKPPGRREPRWDGGCDALTPTRATLTQRMPWPVAAVWQRTWRAGAGSGRWRRG
jgi:hypothetical protein